MSLQIIKGNIFNTKAQTIVNTVNCVGVMGKGIALVFRLRYPRMFEQYQKYCYQKLITIGKLWLYKGEETEPWVLNFPTKMHWKLPSEYSFIESGLQKFVDTYKEKGITSIAFPLLGVNNGGLDKDRVNNIMQFYLTKCDIPIEIYDYDPKAPDDLYEKFKKNWLAIPNEMKKEITKINSTKRIEIIDNAIKSDEICSMITLIDYPNIGLKTLECCFKIVMNYK